MRLDGNLFIDSNGNIYATHLLEMQILDKEFNTTSSENLESVLKTFQERKRMNGSIFQIIEQDEDLIGSIQVASKDDCNGEFCGYKSRYFIFYKRPKSTGFLYLGEAESHEQEKAPHLSLFEGELYLNFINSILRSKHPTHKASYEKVSSNKEDLFYQQEFIKDGRMAVLSKIKDERAPSIKILNTKGRILTHFYPESQFDGNAAKRSLALYKDVIAY